MEGPAGALAAREGGADRVELCAALAVGGVTPSIGVAAATIAIGLPVHVLIRPVAGGFVYDRDLVEAVARDVRAFVALGVAGVVVGALDANGTLDGEALARWRDAAAGAMTTLHRAIDLAASPLDAARRAASLGINRILTSGGARTAPEGSAVIGAMVAAVGADVEIMAGAGVTPTTARALVEVTGVRAVHASARSPRPRPDRRIADLGFGPDDDRATDPNVVAAIRSAIMMKRSHS